MRCLQPSHQPITAARATCPKSHYLKNPTRPPPCHPLFSRPIRTPSPVVMMSLPPSDPRARLRAHVPPHLPPPPHAAAPPCAQFSPRDPRPRARLAALSIAHARLTSRDMSSAPLHPTHATPPADPPAPVINLTSASPSPSPSPSKLTPSARPVPPTRTETPDVPADAPHPDASLPTRGAAPRSQVAAPSSPSPSSTSDIVPTSTETLSAARVHESVTSGLKPMDIDHAPRVDEELINPSRTLRKHIVIVPPVPTTTGVPHHRDVLAPALHVDAHHVAVKLEDQRAGPSPSSSCSTVPTTTSPVPTHENIVARKITRRISVKRDVSLVDTEIGSVAESSSHTKAKRMKRANVQDVRASVEQIPKPRKAKVLRASSKQPVKRKVAASKQSSKPPDGKTNSSRPRATKSKSRNAPVASARRSKPRKPKPVPKSEDQLHHQNQDDIRTNGSASKATAAGDDDSSHGNGLDALTYYPVRESEYDPVEDINSCRANIDSDSDTSDAEYVATGSRSQPRRRRIPGRKIPWELRIIR